MLVVRMSSGLKMSSWSTSPVEETSGTPMISAASTGIRCCCSSTVRRA